MTQEQKDLLLKDLCARMPYDVKVNCNDKVYNFAGIQFFNICILTNVTENNAITTAGIKYVKPYLFPLSSMTEEQQIDLTEYLNARVFINGEISFQSLYANTMDRWKRVFEWCIKNHFDICGLIPMGLAEDATGKNIY